MSDSRASEEVGSAREGDADELVRLYEAGRTQAEIALHFGVQQASISKRMKKIGLMVRLAPGECCPFDCGYCGTPIVIDSWRPKKFCSRRCKNYSRQATKGHTDSERRYRERWPERYQARLKFCSAVQCGRIKRPETCSSCGIVGRIEGHHHKGYDEAHWYDVVWLCKKCHEEADHAAV